MHFNAGHARSFSALHGVHGFSRCFSAKKLAGRLLLGAAQRLR
jgi:hypothetical protein